MSGGFTPNSVVGDGVSGDEVVTDRLELLLAALSVRRV